MKRLIVVVGAVAVVLATAAAVAAVNLRVMHEAGQEPTRAVAHREGDMTFLDPGPSHPRPRMERRGPGFSTVHLSPQQMDVLRISAMAHVPPETVIAVARGDRGTSSATAEQVQKVAQYINVDLRSLANVQAIPRMEDRGHGDPHEGGEEGDD